MTEGAEAPAGAGAASGAARGEVPGAAPGEAPGAAWDEAPGAAPGEVPGVAWDEAPGAAPGEVPGVAWDEAPGAAPGEVPGAAWDEVPGATPGKVSGAASGAAGEAAPDGPARGAPEPAGAALPIAAEALPGAAALWAVAEALADAAAARCLPLFRSPALACDNKAAGGLYDPVTEADREAEAAMRAILAERRPADGIHGEEFGRTTGRSGLTWVLDPIDGTRAFLSGAPSWGTLIALDAGAGPMLGIIDQPFTGERFMGGLGRAVLRRGTGERPLGVRRCAGLAEAVLFTTFPEIGTPAERAAFERVRDRVRLTRYGLDCYAYALLALGQIDLVIEAGLQPYDIQAPQAVIEAAGGRVTDWRGGPAHGGGRVVAAGDPGIHAAAVALLSQAED